ncbi:hypothetical protein Rin_00012500 [Candidatus Regiella insecticola 5.15]|uniref:Beta-galactosidase n=1 Tax=Candidatus Regiella insecticola 5.15 TaxID=1005043 RepID=G2GZM7_9ENTR|nr:hypothetical protein [Candidatus Regiella insecticola]EGY28784.1 hypothetical protein Rin_00012500 [Candidatus Regiella insecticola 5.15]
MKNVIKLCFFLLLIAGNVASVAAEHPPQHYIYFYHREAAGANIRVDKALQDARFSGAQIVYTWRNLEPSKDQYDFSAIKEDLLYLNSIGKQLWIQLQEKSFTPHYNVPDYILQDPLYKGGVLKQSMLTAPERDPNKPLAADEYGWSAKMWEQPVRKRYQKLVQQLGREFDGKIAGINFSESSLEIGIENADGSTTFPGDFTPKAYVDAVRENMQVLAGAFKKSIPMVYLNFVPGEWLPWDDKNYMRSLFAQAEKLKMGIGGPDLMPYRKSHMAQSYGFFKTFPSTLVKGMAVQEGNLRQINPKTGKKNTVADILDFAQHYLGLNYIFWVEDEPYFSDEVLRQLPGKN